MDTVRPPKSLNAGSNPVGDAKMRSYTMKYVLGWLVAHACYILGHNISKAFELTDNRVAVELLYPVYNRLMLWSCDINDWANLDLWEQIKTND